MIVSLQGVYMRWKALKGVALLWCSAAAEHPNGVISNLFNANCFDIFRRFSGRGGYGLLGQERWYDYENDCCLSP